MRNIIKNQTTTTIEVSVYNTKSKKEEVITITTPGKPMPTECVEIPNTRKVVEEVEKKYKMTPEEFFKHATIVE